MRIGRLARENEIPLAELNAYLKSNDLIEKDLAPNSKIDDHIIELIAQKYGLTFPDEESTEASPDVQEEEIVSEIVESVKSPEESAHTEESQTDQEVEPDEEPEQESFEEKPMEIRSDHLLEMLESEEDLSIDLTEIKRITAPKLELDGLKVVGKIDLPEPKPKPEKREEDEESGSFRGRRRRPELSEEEKEKRRLRAKRKKEEYEARQEKRRKEREHREMKARKAAHYKQKLAQAPPKSSKPKTKAKKKAPINPTQDSRPKPKTIFGKFIRWLNPEE